MHGNLHSPVGLNDAAAAPGMALWFASPAARDYFDASSLTDADRARFLAHRNSRRQQEFQVSRALKNSVLTERDVHSLSHSGGHAALLSASSALSSMGVGWGVDLEASRPRDVLRIARFAFDEREVAVLEGQPADPQEELFYTFWTLKESLAKALQLELVDALRRCVFTRTATGWAGVAPTHLPWSAQVFRPRPGIFLAAACVGTSVPPTIQQWEWPPRQAADWPVIARAFAAAEAAGR